MRITVKAVPRSSKAGLEENGPGHFKARLTSPPEKGKANAELVELVARHFGVKKSQVAIVSGSKSRDKTVEIT